MIEKIDRNYITDRIVLKKRERRERERENGASNDYKQIAYYSIQTE
jgi:hypothetical protein